MATAKELDAAIFPQGGNYLWSALSGDGNATKRQAVMALLGQKLPKSKCKYNVVRDALIAHAGIPAACMAEQDKLLTSWIMNHD